MAMKIRTHEPSSFTSWDLKPTKVESLFTYVPSATKAIPEILSCINEKSEPNKNEESHEMTTAPVTIAVKRKFRFANRRNSAKYCMKCAHRPYMKTKSDRNLHNEIFKLAHQQAA